ncbi:MAG: hypothetical protein ACREBU_16825 [Nitrososphaera sp.]
MQPLSVQVCCNGISSGVLQTDNKEPKKRKTLGRIALWLNESENGKAPKFRGVLETEKGTFRISLWDREEKGEESPTIFDDVKITGTGEFFCRYCRRLLAENDVLWDACNNVRWKKRGYRSETYPFSLFQVDVRQVDRTGELWTLIL